MGKRTKFFDRAALGFLLSRIGLSFPVLLLPHRLNALKPKKRSFLSDPGQSTILDPYFCWENYLKLWKLWKTMENCGKLWKTLENYGKLWKTVNC